jgi:SagB-type dehydrogenase family enzyme
MIKLFSVLILILSLSAGCAGGKSPPAKIDIISTPIPTAPNIKLPEPRLTSTVSLEESLQKRRSIREYSLSPLTLSEISQLLWAGQGITSDNGGRTAPSAGGLYPLEVYLVAGNVENIAPGIYHYNPQGHEIIFIKGTDIREGLANAALGQTPVRNGAIDIIISAVYERTNQKYGERGIRYAQLEAGHAAQNICLETTALNLGAVTIGAFDDNQVKGLLGMAENEVPLYIIPVGKTQ